MPTDPPEEPARASHLRAFFDATVDLPPAQRATWIAANVADADDRVALQALLDADDRDSLLDRSADERLDGIGLDDDALAARMIGRQVGAFRLTRLLGEGGMAVVFLGEREGDGFHQQAAVKLLRRGLSSPLEQRLFRRERQALASLSHPNITHLIDGGISDGSVPYLVLEYVNGVPITDYATAQGCGLRKRLALFVVVCRAVAAAHRQLIVHRDLKPANILVDAEGQVKLLDFGIAKLLADDGDGARTEMTVLTPGYAAPEQFAGGTVTTATDVYSLGVVLHELLRGERPPAPTTDRTAAVRGTIAAVPGPRTAFAIGRDLDNVLRKALSPEAERRYDSAAEFADDIERHLDGKPVQAHPPSAWYRTRKFVGRHRVGVIGSVAFVVALLGAAAVSIAQADHARHQSTRANAMRDFIITAFSQATPGSPREGPPRITDVVQEAIRTARADTRMEPGVRTELLTQLGRVLREQGALKEAADVLDDTLDQARGRLGDADGLTLGAELERLRVAVDLQDDQARTRVDALLAHAANAPAELRSAALVQASIIAIRERDFPRALADSASALALARTRDDLHLLGEALGGAFQARLSSNDLRGALALGEERLSIVQAQFGAQDWRVANVLDSLSRVQRRLGELDAAEASIHAALAIDDAVLKPDDWRRAAHLNALLMIHRQRHDAAAAADIARETLRINRLAFGDDNPKTLREAANLGSLLMGLDRPGEALPLFREVAQAYRPSSGPPTYASADARANAAHALGMSGQVDAGIAELRAAIADFEAMPRPEYDGLAEACERLAELALARERLEAARGMPECIDRAIAALARPDDYWIGRADLLRAELSLRHGDARAALAHLDAAAVVNTATNPDVVLQIEWSLLRAEAHRVIGDAATAAEALAEGRRRMAVLKHPPERLRRLAGLPDAP